MGTEEVLVPTTFHPPLLTLVRNVAVKAVSQSGTVKVLTGVFKRGFQALIYWYTLVPSTSRQEKTTLLISAPRFTFVLRDDAVSVTSRLSLSHFGSSED